MSKRTTDTTKLGIFVIAGILLFALGAYMIGNQDNIFQPMFRITAIFHDANGLKQGNNVRYAGIVVGSVERIDFVNDSTLRVHMKLEKKVKGIIRKNAVASIDMEGLVGSMVINIKPGTGSGEPAQDGDEIASDSRPDVLNMLKTLNETNENLKLLSANLLEITGEISEGTGTIPRLLRDEKMGADLAAVFEHVKRSSENLHSLTASLNRELDRVEEGKGTLGYLLHDEELPESLRRLSGQFDSLMQHSVQPLMAHLERAGVDVEKTAGSLRATAEEIGEAEGALHYIVRDSSVARSLRESVEDIRESAEKFNATMDALQSSILFRRYFEKREKEGERK